MEIELIAALIFFAILGIILIINRKKISNEGIFPLFYISMFKTSIGLKAMDKGAKKYKKILLILSRIGIVVGFLGMIFISGMLIYYLVKTILNPSIPSGVQVVLPFRVKGTFYVPFFYWITCLTIIAFVHEFAHGVIARLHNVKIKSSGIAFLSVLVPVVPAAFVEPDDESLKKKSKSKQLGVYAAGPFSNIILAIIAILFILFLFRPVNDAIYSQNGVLITSVQDGFSAQLAGVGYDEIIKGVNSEKINTIQNLTDVLLQYDVGDNISLITNLGEYNITLSANPNNNSISYLGVMLQEHYSLNGNLGNYGWFFKIYDWIAGLFVWLFLLNLGVGLFNLAPLGIADGGRMLQVGLYYFFPKNKVKADKIWKVISMIFLIIVLALIFSGFILG